jgi:ElaB/YqjD/DUF883 family membrane-anchored ribosome-binding protein
MSLIRGKAMENANGNEAGASVTPIDSPPALRTPVASAMQHALTPGAAHRPAMIAPYHVHGSVLEGGDSPAVLAQPAAAAREGQGSGLHPEPHAAKVTQRARVALTDAQYALSRRYRRASDSTDDFVHDNPWKSMALAAVGGLIIGLLASR